MLAIYPLLKPTRWGKWQWNGPAGWQEVDERTGEEPEVSRMGGRADDPKEPQQTQAPTTSSWVSRWAQDVGCPATQVKSYWMSGKAELSDSETSDEDSRPDEEGFADRRSSRSNRNTAPSSAAPDNDSLPEGGRFIAQTPGEDDTGLTVVAGFEQGGCEGLHPLQGLESFCVSEDIEMTGCEPVEILAEEKMDWEWPEVSSPHPCIQQPSELPLEIKSGPYTIWLAPRAPRAPIPPPVGRTKEQEVEAVNFLLAISRDHPELWEILVGVYFSEGRHPRAHLGYDKQAQEILRGQNWEWNWALQDIREQCPAEAPAPYTIPGGQEREFLESLAASILDGNEDLFLGCIKKWQSEEMAHDKCALENILIRAGWCCNLASTPEWRLMAELKNLPEGSHKAELLQQAIRELPRFAWRCIDDPNCMLVPPPKSVAIVCRCRAG
ncbi:hypothetical protein EMPG_13961 [Blastomyces silverae]|uniref:Uncharacterized protein n=1 Tax=Blastomyces silverae TaxID=2060906 RepID=A0A0H1BGK3_9EURO|nr:hypothetical protein EMPG_13961 [Blastomyces silverae]